MSATVIPLASVERIRSQIRRGQELASARFREAFARGPLDALAHVQMQSDALLETAENIKLRGRLSFDVNGDLITPYVERGFPIYRYFDVQRTPEAIFEYWLLVSEIEGSTSWRMTRLIVTRSDYDDALRRMDSPQFVNVLTVSFLPQVEIGDDGTSLLEVTVYSRAGEERVERRTLMLDRSNEFHFHSRQKIAEGRAGVGY